jgi:hypothetical protein
VTEVLDEEEEMAMQKGPDVITSTLISEAKTRTLNESTGVKFYDYDD